MFEIMFTIVPIFIVVVFTFTILTIISPKFRGKIMSHQIKATKYMMEESREDLKDISDNMAYATHNRIKSAARAVKEGLEDNQIYCKHCGKKIDADSKFCSICGKEQ